MGTVEGTAKAEELVRGQRAEPEAQEPLSRVTLRSGARGRDPLEWVSDCSRDRPPIAGSPMLHLFSATGTVHPLYPTLHVTQRERFVCV